MKSENDLIQKLMISKKIMDKHKEMPRGNAQDTLPSTSNIQVEGFSPVAGAYNIPQEFLSESPLVQPPKPELPTKDRILNSKLPDDIKRLMLEHPISQPQTTGPTLSNELVEAASRLMKKESGQSTQKSNPINSNTNVNLNDIRQVVRETVEEVLKENGLLIESVSKTNETIRFQVGEHIFEGKIVKIKKTKK